MTETKPCAEDNDYNPDLGTCPYYAHCRRGAPFGTCSFGCWDEPRCITDEPDEGWADYPLDPATDSPLGSPSSKETP